MCAKSVFYDSIAIERKVVETLIICHFFTILQLLFLVYDITNCRRKTVIISGYF